MTITTNTSLSVCTRVVDTTAEFLKLASGVYTWDSNPGNANQFASLVDARAAVAGDPLACVVPLICLEEWATGGGAVT